MTVNRTQWLDLNDGIAGCNGGLLAKTSNGGVNWTVSNPGIPTISDVAFSDKNLWYAVSNTSGNFPILKNTDNITSISLNINAGIEGFWDGTTQVSDTVTVELRSSVTPYNTIDVSKTVLTSGTGFGTVEFSSAPSGSYYIVVKHRNSIETWSASPLSMSAGGSYNYNFTTSASQTYGNNTVLNLGRYCNYSGDVNQDGFVDLNDIGDTYNGSSDFLSGYVVTDLNGDNVVNMVDVLIAYNNASAFVSVMKP